MVGSVPAGCGQCMPCRINKVRIWTHRLMLEGECHEGSCFVTLTYKEVPADGSLEPKVFQDFLKRLRFRLGSRSIRFFGVGEYGDRNFRPHYHVLLFGLPVASSHVDDRVFSERNVCSCATCSVIRLAWSFGRIHVGEFNADTASYCAGYITKKLTKAGDPRLAGREPEFSRSSNRPGIGLGSLERIERVLQSPYGRQLLDELGDVPTVLNRGNKAWPLGTYLRRKLRAKLGLPEGSKSAGYKKYALEMRDMFNDSINAQEVKASLSRHLSDKSKGRRASIEARLKIHSSVRSL